MSNRNNPGARLAVIGSYQGVLHNRKKWTAAIVKNSLTVRLAGPRKIQKDNDGNDCFGEARAFLGLKRGLA